MYGDILSSAANTPVKIAEPDPAVPLKVCAGTSFACPLNIGFEAGHETTPAALEEATACGTLAGQEMTPAALADCEVITVPEALVAPGTNTFVELTLAPIADTRKAGFVTSPTP